MTDRLLTPKQVARELGVTERTLARWRVAGVGPRWTRVGPRLVRYEPPDPFAPAAELVDDREFPDVPLPFEAAS